MECMDKIRILYLVRKHKKFIQKYSDYSAHFTRKLQLIDQKFRGDFNDDEQLREFLISENIVYPSIISKIKYPSSEQTAPKESDIMVNEHFMKEVQQHKPVYLKRKRPQYLARSVYLRDDGTIEGSGKRPSMKWSDERYE